MTLSKSDLSHIKWSLLAFLLTLCAGSATIVASKNFMARSQHDQSNAKDQLVKARSQLTTALQDRENMKTYMLEYGNLLERNIIGNNQRLDWVEGMDKLRKQNLVLGFKYAITPQKIYVADPALDSGNFQLNASDMTLQLDLLHEGQLTAFFDAMRTDIDGWFILDHCSLERSPAAAGDGMNLPAPSTIPLLKADCSGEWLTLNQRNAR